MNLAENNVLKMVFVSVEFELNVQAVLDTYLHLDRLLGGVGSDGLLGDLKNNTK